MSVSKMCNVCNQAIISYTCKLRPGCTFWGIEDNKSSSIFQFLILWAKDPMVYDITRRFPSAISSQISETVEDNDHTKIGIDFS